MIGRRVGHYEIFEELGGGGMGVVYRARDVRLDRTVALKFLPIEWKRNRDARERFSREARAASAIDHPNICTIHDIDETEDGQMFLVMAYCPGETLKRKISRARVPAKEAIEYAIQTADALANAHRAGVVHRDIKPANILLDSRNKVKVVDFGLAKLANLAEITQAGTTVGTPAYMAPEQATGDPVDHRADIFSLGVVLYEMLAGKRPFGGDSHDAIIYSLLNNDPGPIDDPEGDIGPGLQHIIDRCLEKDPDKRYQCADELLAELLREQDGQHPSIETTVWATPVRPKKRRVAALIGVVCGLAAVALAAWLVVGWAQPIPVDKTVVVIPFEGGDDSPAVSALCDGLTHEVTDTLRAMRRFEGNLTVVPPEAVWDEKVRTAAEAVPIFGANLALTGKIDSTEHDLRVSANLLSAADGKILRHRTIAWSAGRGTTLHAVLAAALSEMLELELDQAERAAVAVGGTIDVKASELYTEAVGMLRFPGRAAHVEQAIGKLRSALEYDPRFAMARAQLAKAARLRYEQIGENGWLEAARTYAERAVADGPLLPQAHVEMGLVTLAAGDPVSALGHVEKALDLDPINPEARRAKAEILMAADRQDEAEETFTSAIALNPDDWTTIYDAGRFFFDRGAYPTANEFFRQAVDLKPENNFGLNALGGSLFMTGRYPEARDAFERSIAIEPTYWATSNLGTLEFYSENYPAAIDMYHRALAIDDTDHKIWNNLGECLRWSGAAKAEVVKAYRRAAELIEEHLEGEPGNRDELLVILASCLTVTGETGRAGEILGGLDPEEITDPSLDFMIAAAFEDLGRRDEALTWTGRAITAGYPVEVINVYAGFEDLRKEARYRELVNGRFLKAQ